MLIRGLKPAIVLPDREYSHKQLYDILLHELTHMRRFDVFVKWMSLIACAVHWFNPLVWVARREIDRACELACDEAVIRNMNAHNKQSYGETLIAMASTSKIPLPVLSTTMCAEKQAIKERLVAIMKSRKHTKLAVLVSALILLTAVLAACALGAAGGSNANPGDNNNFVDVVNKEHENTLDDNFTKQAVGLMVKTILAPFGYEVWKQKALPKNSRATKFHTASVYRYSHTAPRTMKVEKRIIEINPTTPSPEVNQ